MIMSIGNVPVTNRNGKSKKHGFLKGVAII